jgi:hypothetical protein
VQNLILEMCDGIVDRAMDQHCADKYADQWDVQGFNRAFEASLPEYRTKNGMKKNSKQMNMQKNLQLD